MAFDKELLFKPRLPEIDYELDGLGTIRIRALSRAEVMGCRNVKAGPGQAEAIERKMLALALVDPELTEAEVGRWQKASPAGELEPVTDKIAEMSGMKDESAKDAYKEMDVDSDVEFRSLPG